MNDQSTANQTVDVDPVTASVIQGALENIAVEMGYKLMRMSYSSIIRESASGFRVAIPIEPTTNRSPGPQAHGSGSQHGIEKKSEPIFTF